jgi:hypothetical protein
MDLSSNDDPPLPQETVDEIRNFKRRDSAKRKREKEQKQSEKAAKIEAEYGSSSVNNYYNINKYLYCSESLQNTI